MAQKDYRLNAYLKASGKYDQDSSSTPASSGKISKPVFTKVNREGVPLDKAKHDEMEKKKQVDERTQKQAELAARTGVWFEKQTTPSDDDVKQAASRLTSGGLVKVPGIPEHEGAKESIYRRVAKFLVIIGVDEAAKIIP